MFTRCEVVVSESIDIWNDAAVAGVGGWGPGRVIFVDSVSLTNDLPMTFTSIFVTAHSSSYIASLVCLTFESN